MHSTNCTELTAGPLESVSVQTQENTALPCQAQMAWADRVPLLDLGVTALRLSSHLSPSGFPKLCSPSVTANVPMKVGKFAQADAIDWPELALT